MASNKTPNLGLDIWQAEDYFKRAEVNNNFTKIDAKVKENSDKIGVLQESTKKKMTVDDIKEPFVIAHRGGSNIYPENTLEAYKNVVANGIRLIEQDVQMLSDGSLVIMHDSTVDRTTDGTGNVSDFFASAWKNLNVDPATFLSAAYQNTKAPFMADVFNEFGDSVIYLPETKNGAATQKLVDLIKLYKLEKNVIVQCFDLASLQPACDAGLWTLALGDSVDLVKAKQMGVRYIGCSLAATDAYITDILSKGLKPTVYTVNRRFEWENFKAKGYVGAFSDDPLYTSGFNTHIRKTDPFKFKMFYHGHIDTIGGRGIFTGANRLSFTGGASQFVLQGWGSPIQADTYKINFSLTYDTITDATKWGSIALCSPVDLFADTGNVNSKAYHILFRASGRIDSYKIKDGTPTVVGSKDTEAVVVGQTIKIEVSVSPTQIVITRKDLATPVSLTITDTEFRGKNFFFGKQINEVSFSGVTIS